MDETPSIRFAICPAGNVEEDAQREVERILEGAAVPTGELIIVLGGESLPVFGQMPTTGTCVSRPFEAGLTRNWSADKDEWFRSLGYTWRHVVFLPDSALANAGQAPEYLAFLVGHELEHARIVEEDVALAALCRLAGFSCWELGISASYVSLPEEVRCDHAGVFFARQLHGSKAFDTCLRRLIAEEPDAKRREYLEYLRGILLGGERKVDLSAELTRFVLEHDLQGKIAELHASSRYRDIGEHAELRTLRVLLRA